MIPPHGAEDGTRLRALVVDDEPPARRGLCALLVAHPDIEVIGEATSGRTALAAIESLRPDLVFLDVQMPDGDGLDVLRRIPPERAPAVIFTTAFDEYALKAFDAHAVDYLLKPYDRERFTLALDRARRRIRAGAVDAQLTSLLARVVGGADAAPPFLERITVRDGVRSTLVPVQNIECFEAEENYVRLWIGERSLLTRDTLTGLASRLDPRRFVRVHRSWIVPIARVVRTESMASGEFVLTLNTGRRVVSGRTFRAAVQAALGL